MKRRVIFSNLSKVRYDSLDDIFEEVPIEDVENRKREREREREKEKDNGCFAGFFGFFRFLVKK